MWQCPCSWQHVLSNGCAQQQPAVRVTSTALLEDCFTKPSMWSSDGEGQALLLLLLLLLLFLLRLLLLLLICVKTWLAQTPAQLLMEKGRSDHIKGVAVNYFERYCDSYRLMFVKRICLGSCCRLLFPIGSKALCGFLCSPIWVLYLLGGNGVAC